MMLIVMSLPPPTDSFIVPVPSLSVALNAPDVIDCDVGDVRNVHRVAARDGAGRVVAVTSLPSAVAVNAESVVPS